GNEHLVCGVTVKRLRQSAAVDENRAGEVPDAEPLNRHRLIEPLLAATRPLASDIASEPTIRAATELRAHTISPWPISVRTAADAASFDAALGVGRQRSKRVVEAIRGSVG